MSSRFRRKKSGLSDAQTGVLLSFIGLALIVGFVVVWWKVTQREPLLDNNCARSGPSSIHVIMVDRSDPISGQQAQRIRQYINDLKENASPGDRFDVYTFEGDTKNVLEPILVICAPQKPETTDPWTQNRGQVQKRFEEQFSAVLDRVINDLLRESTKSSSPIIESLHAAAITSFGPVDGGSIPLRVTMISDLVQHSALTSHFRSEPNFAQLARSANWPSARPNLKGADVVALYLLRPTAMRANAPIQNRGHQAFWEQLISASGGRLISVDPL
jgi:hypothetical protein